MGYAEAQYVIDEILEKIKPEVTFRGDLNARLTLRSKTALNVTYIVDLTENDLIPNTTTFECQKTIWVDPGLYSTSIVLSGVYSVSGADVDATNILTKSLVKYDTTKKYVKRITSDSTVTLPDNLNVVKISAIAGGGYGGTGGSYVTNWGGQGAGGGGSGERIIDRMFDVSENKTLNVLIGKGGIASTRTSATPTVIGDLFTLAGGENGNNGQSGGNNRTSGAGGGTKINGISIAGGASVSCYKSNSTSPYSKPGRDGSAGAGGSGGSGEGNGGNYLTDTERGKGGKQSSKGGKQAYSHYDGGPGGAGGGGMNSNGDHVDAGGHGGDSFRRTQNDETASLTPGNGKEYGSGGGGSAGSSSGNSSASLGGDGSDGIVVIFNYGRRYA